jgi:hypothetical protein
MPPGGFRLAIVNARALEAAQAARARLAAVRSGAAGWCWGVRPRPARTHGGSTLRIEPLPQRASTYVVRRQRKGDRRGRQPAMAVG